MCILIVRTGLVFSPPLQALQHDVGKGRRGCCFFFWFFAVLYFLFPSEYESPAIVEDGEGHEREQEDHAQHLGAFHEFLARLAPRGNFVEEEEHVAAIEGGDGEDVDEGEHEGDEGR